MYKDLATVICWGNTVETVLFENLSSMKPYPSVVHAYISKLRPVTCLFEPNKNR